MVSAAGVPPAGVTTGWVGPLTVTPVALGGLGAVEAGVGVGDDRLVAALHGADAAVPPSPVGAGNSKPVPGSAPCAARGGSRTSRRPARAGPR